MKKQLIAFAALSLVLGGCAMRTKVLDTAAISMTKPSLAPGEKLKETGAVSGKFCADSFNDKGAIGLIDKCVEQAQTQNGVDWILNASFYSSGNCMEVEGTGAKLMAGADTATMAPAAAPAAATKTAPAKTKKK